MSALTLSGIIFVLTLGGIFIGTLLRRTLPEHHLNEHARDVVRLGVGLVATIAALVLGLLIAAAKGSFDTQISQVRQITADLILLDNILAQYGPEARPVREQIRCTVDPFADELWREKETGSTGPVEMNTAAERVYLEINRLSPHDDLQRSLKARAVQISNDLAQVRFLLSVESENLIAKPFLAVLGFWLTIIFASFSLFSPLNGTVLTRLATRPGHADDVRAAVALREVIGRDDREDQRHFVGVGVVPDRKPLEGEEVATHQMNLVVLDQLAHLGKRILGVRFGILDLELNVETSELVALLREIELEAVGHVAGAFRDEPRERNGHADPYRFCVRRPGRP